MVVGIDGVGVRTGGAASVLCELIQHMPQMKPAWKWHVFLLPRAFRDFEIPPAGTMVTIESVPNAHTEWGRLNWLLRVSRHRLKAINANVVFSMANIGRLFPSIPELVMCHQPNAFFGDGLHNASLWCRVRMRSMRYLILRGALASKGVIVQTDTMRKRMQAFEPRLATRLQVIPSGYRVPASSLSLRPEFQQVLESVSRPRLIYVAHPSTHKNHEGVIGALPEILRTHPTATLMLTLDRDRPPNASYATFVRNILAQMYCLGVQDHVSFLGILNSREVRYALRASDLMVYPSLSESFGLPLAEAMEAGCPIAVADMPYAHDVAGPAAEYFDPSRPSSIAAVVNQLLYDQVRLRELRACGEKRSEEFAYSSIASKLIQAIGQAAGAME